ncbi:MAG: MMPL family transporter [Oscillibacter ruminantium]|uniref:efflux RND transporter permease subunit n=1 Tax=Oscillibacter ruminantium TaxID=1263547 RepID=UPI002B1FF5AD|nr:MMPL family transporter [Oscillibacter ruminantium]MEA5042331.1 MMPL family transporter [Oscillibacter ruminantium]
MIQKVAHGLTRKPKLIALIAVLLLIPAGMGFIATRINYDILSYLPQDAESSQGEKLLEEPFQMAATSMLIVEGMPAGYSSQLIQDIQEIPGVSNAIWVSSLVGIQIPTDFIPADLREMFYAGDATMMVIQYDHPGASDETMEAIDQVRSVCNDKCFLAGFSVVIKDTRDLMDSELPLFVGLAVILALVAMSVTLESTVLPFIFLASIGLAIIYNFGSNIFLGEISYLTKAIAAVLQLGVTMDYSIFLYRRYEEERENHEDKRDAMASAIVAAFSSLSGSSLTTIAGFLALCFMRLTLGRDIGIVMAKGVVLGIATVILVLPSLVLLFDKQIDKHKHRTLIPSFDKINVRILKHRWRYVVLALLLFVPAIYAQNHAGIYYKLDESLPQDLPSIVANEKMKDDFDMATSHFVVLRDDVSATDMSDMETALKNLPGITSVLSYHSMLGAGIPEFFVPEDVRTMLKQDGWQMMMVNSKYATASTEVAQQLEQMRSIIKQYDPQALVTGEAAMTNDLIETSAVDFNVTNYISVAAIFLIVAIVFQSISVPVVLVSSIELAIFINQGVPYFTGTEIPFIAPTIIGCVQLGATVDYAILMTTRFQEELRAGKSRDEAIHIAATSSDPSIITSSLVLFCATLGVSFVSSIDLIGTICVMLARGALISAAMSIFIMPSILSVCEPVFNKTSRYWRVTPPVKPSRIAKALSSAAEKLPAGKKNDSISLPPADDETFSAAQETTSDEKVPLLDSQTEMISQKTEEPASGKKAFKKEKHADRPKKALFRRKDKKPAAPEEAPSPDAEEAPEKEPAQTH